MEAAKTEHQPHLEATRPRYTLRTTKIWSARDLGEYDHGGERILSRRGSKVHQHARSLRDRNRNADKYFVYAARPTKPLRTKRAKYAFTQKTTTVRLSPPLALSVWRQHVARGNLLASLSLFPSRSSWLLAYLSDLRAVDICLMEDAR